MTLALDPKILAAVHAALKSVPDKKNTIPVCGMYHMAAEDGRLAVTATDMDMETVMTVEGVSADLVPVCVAPHLIEAGGALSAKAVTIAIDEREAVFSAGKARYRAPIMPGSDFPRANMKFSGSCIVPGRDLADIFDATVAAVSTEETRFYLAGVCLQVIDARLNAVATSGHRLHTTSVPAPLGLTLPPDGIIVPTKAVKELARLARKAGEEPILLETGDTAIAVTAGNERLASRLIDGHFPDWRRVVPQPCGKVATFDLAEFIAALDRVGKVQAATMEKKKEGSGVKLEEDGEFLTIAAKGIADEAVDAVRAEFDGGTWGRVGVAVRYLRETMGDLKERGSETVTIDLADPGAPMRIESPTDEDFIAVIMPMRI